MLNLTREEAIENHRKMWNWIADESIRQGQTVSVYEYFEEMEIPYDERPESWHLCEYANDICCCCPINWGNDGSCLGDESLFTKWRKCDDSDYEEAARLAREIANLPEREVK